MEGKANTDRSLELVVGFHQIAQQSPLHGTPARCKVQNCLKSGLVWINKSTFKLLRHIWIGLSWWPLAILYWLQIVDCCLDWSNWLPIWIGLVGCQSGMVWLVANLDWSDQLPILLIIINPSPVAACIQNSFFFQRHYRYPPILVITKVQFGNCRDSGPNIMWTLSILWMRWKPQII